MARIIYQEGSNTIRTDNNCLVALLRGDRWVLDIDKCIEHEVATKIFRRWHELYTYAEPEKIASALNDAVNNKLFIFDCVPIYSRGKLNKTLIESAIKMRDKKNKQYTDFSCQHDIATNSIKYWFDNALQQPCLTITAKEVKQ